LAVTGLIGGGCRLHFGPLIPGASVNRPHARCGEAHVSSGSVPAFGGSGSDAADD
jgi:hypothetical protein